MTQISSDLARNLERLISAATGARIIVPARVDADDDLVLTVAFRRPDRMDRETYLPMLRSQLDRLERAGEEAMIDITPLELDEIGLSEEEMDKREERAGAYALLPDPEEEGVMLNADGTMRIGAQEHVYRLVLNAEAEEIEHAIEYLNLERQQFGEFLCQEAAQALNEERRTNHPIAHVRGNRIRPKEMQVSTAFNLDESGTTFYRIRIAPERNITEEVIQGVRQRMGVNAGDSTEAPPAIPSDKEGNHQDIILSGDALIGLYAAYAGQHQGIGHHIPQAVKGAAITLAAGAVIGTSAVAGTAAVAGPPLAAHALSAPGAWEYVTHVHDNFSADTGSQIALSDVYEQDPERGEQLQRYLVDIPLFAALIGETEERVERFMVEKSFSPLYTDDPERGKELAAAIRTAILLEGDYCMAPFTAAQAEDIFQALIPESERGSLTSSQIMNMQGIASISLAAQLQQGKLDYADYALEPVEVRGRTVTPLDMAKFMREVFVPEIIESAHDTDLPLESVFAMWGYAQAVTDNIQFFNEDVELAGKQVKAATAVRMAEQFNWPGLQKLFPQFGELDPYTHLGLLATAGSVEEAERLQAQRPQYTIDGEYVYPEAQEPEIDPIDAAKRYFSDPLAEENQADVMKLLRGSTHYIDGRRILSIDENARALLVTTQFQDMENREWAKAVEAYGSEHFPDDIAQGAAELNEAHQALDVQRQRVIETLDWFASEHGDILTPFIGGNGMEEAWTAIGLAPAAEGEPLTMEAYRQALSIHTRLGQGMLYAERFLYANNPQSREVLYDTARNVLMQHYPTMPEERAVAAFVRDQFENEGFYAHLLEQHPEIEQDIRFLMQEVQALDPLIDRVHDEDMRFLDDMTKDGRMTDPKLQAQFNAGLMRMLYDIAEEKFNPPEPDNPDTRRLLTFTALLAREVSPPHFLGGDGEKLGLLHTDPLYNQEGVIGAAHNFWTHLLSTGQIPPDQAFSFDPFFEQTMRGLSDYINASKRTAFFDRWTNEEQEQNYPFFARMIDDGILKAFFAMENVYTPSTERDPASLQSFIKAQSPRTGGAQLYSDHPGNDKAALRLIIDDKAVTANPLYAEFVDTDEGRQLIIRNEKDTNNPTSTIDNAEKIGKILLYVELSEVEPQKFQRSDGSTGEYPYTLGFILEGDLSASVDEINERLIQIRDDVATAQTWMMEHQHDPLFQSLFEGLFNDTGMLVFSPVTILRYQPHFTQDGEDVSLHVHDVFTDEEATYHGIQNLPSLFSASLGIQRLPDMNAEELNALAEREAGFMFGFMPEQETQEKNPVLGFHTQRVASWQDRESGAEGSMPLHVQF